MISKASRWWHLSTNFEKETSTLHLLSVINHEQFPCSGCSFKLRKCKQCGLHFIAEHDWVPVLLTKQNFSRQQHWVHTSLSCFSYVGVHSSWDHTGTFLVDAGFWVAAGNQQWRWNSDSCVTALQCLAHLFQGSTCKCLLRFQMFLGATEALFAHCNSYFSRMNILQKERGVENLFWI